MAPMPLKTASFNQKPTGSQVGYKPGGAKPHHALHPPTILLVEDQKGPRELTRQTLMEQGYTVLFAADGDAALRVCQQHLGQIHVLVADVIMPGMSGTQLAGRIRALRPKIQVLLISGLIPETMVRSEISAGAAFLPKPFSSAQLLAKIQELLGPTS